MKVGERGGNRGFSFLAVELEEEDGINEGIGLFGLLGFGVWSVGRGIGGERRIIANYVNVVRIGLFRQFWKRGRCQP